MSTADAFFFLSQFLRPPPPPPSTTTSSGTSGSSNVSYNQTINILNSTNTSGITLALRTARSVKLYDSEQFDNVVSKIVEIGENSGPQYNNLLQMNQTYDQELTIKDATSNLTASMDGEKLSKSTNNVKNDNVQGIKANELTAEKRNDGTSAVDAAENRKVVIENISNRTLEVISITEQLQELIERLAKDREDVDGAELPNIGRGMTVCTR